MNIIKQYCGSKENVWSEARTYLWEQPILVDAGEQWSTHTIVPVQSKMDLWFHAVHTGDSAQFLIGLADGRRNYGLLLILKGVEWDINALMVISANAVNKKFAVFSVRQQRSILIDIGKAAYVVLKRLNEMVELANSSDDLQHKVIYDQYMDLLDIEWIEEKMGEF